MASSAQEAWGIHWWAQHHHRPHPERSSEGSLKAFPKSWWAAGFWDFWGSLGTYKSVSGLQELTVGVGAREPLVQTVSWDATQKRNLGDVLDSVPHFVVQIARRLGCEGLKGEFSATTLSFVASAPAPAKGTSRVRNFPERGKGTLLQTRSRHASLRTF